MRAARDEPGEMRHVDEQQRIDLARDLRERGEVEDAWIRAVPGHDHLGPHLERSLTHLIHVQDARRQ